ncbi:MAG: hypothetical protein H0Z39_05310 [Peptococcaceae bacterium]|nr:hypothetical protein [Peptococcaceae bacterium]
MTHFNCLSTGIGSLPFKEPRDALSLIAKNFPAVPHWPQLPQRGSQEGFVLQFLNPLVENGLLERRGEKVFFATDAPDWADRLANFYALYLAIEEGDEAVLNEFGMPESAAAGFYAFLEEVPHLIERAQALKGQIVGPLTVGFQLTDQGGRPAYYDEQIRDVIVKNLALHARWQARTLAAYGKKVLLFIDEPGISIYGQSTYITVTREMIMEDLNAIVGGIHAENALSGVHSCAAADWSILTESNTDIISFDAYEFFSSVVPYRNAINKFLERGGNLAWGIVPTSEKAFAEDSASLVARFEDYQSQLGIDEKLLKKQALITPACGAGTLAPELTERIYNLTARVSALLRKE